MRPLSSLTLALVLAAGTVAVAGAGMDMQPYQGSAEFEQLKSLIGTWEGEMPMEGKGGDAQHQDMPPMKITLEYRLTAGGSAIQETFSPGTPMEMITMYHDRGGRLSLTHYCMLGNQPRMDLEGSKEGQLTFSFSKENDLDPAEGTQMCGLELFFVDENSITQRWTTVQDGAELPARDMQLTRVQ